MLKEHRHEGALPRLKLFSTAIDRTLSQRRAWQLLRRRFLEANLNAVGNALDLFNDGIGERIGIFPECVELLLYPFNAFRGGIFPQYLVVMREGALGLVDRSKKAGL